MTRLVFNPHAAYSDVGGTSVNILKFFDADADPGIFLTLDPGSGMEKNRIRDKHPGSATLNPSPFWSKKSVFPDPVDCLHEVEDVVRAVHEEAGDDDVQTGDVLCVVVHVQEVARRHREPVQSTMWV